jgi:hypothetical protein
MNDAFDYLPPGVPGLEINGPDVPFVAPDNLGDILSEDSPNPVDLSYDEN